MTNVKERNSFLTSVLRAGVSSGLVNEIFHPKPKLQRNLNDRPSEIHKFRLAAATSLNFQSRIS